MVNLRVPVEGNASDAALDYAWAILQYTPFDGGSCKIEFNPGYRWEYRRDPVTGDPMINKIDNTPLGHDVPDGWRGFRSASTEEGFTNVSLSVRCIDHEEDVWMVDVGTESRDCDGRYTGGYEMVFQTGKVPCYQEDWMRDHSAEAAGY